VSTRRELKGKGISQSDLYPILFCRRSLIAGASARFIQRIVKLVVFVGSISWISADLGMKLRRNLSSVCGVSSICRVGHIVLRDSHSIIRAYTSIILQLWQSKPTLLASSIFSADAEQIQTKEKISYRVLRRLEDIRWKISQMWPQTLRGKECDLERDNQRTNHEQPVLCSDVQNVSTRRELKSTVCAQSNL